MHRFDRPFRRFLTFLTACALFVLHAPLGLFLLSCSDTSSTMPIFGSAGHGGAASSVDAGPCTDPATTSSTDATSSSSSSSSSGMPDPADNPCNCADKWLLDSCGEDGLGNCWRSDNMQSPVFSCWYWCLDKSTGNPVGYNSCPNPCLLQLDTKTHDPYP